MKPEDSSIIPQSRLKQPQNRIIFFKIALIFMYFAFKLPGSSTLSYIFRAIEEEPIESAGTTPDDCRAFFSFPLHLSGRKTACIAA